MGNLQLGVENTSPADDIPLAKTVILLRQKLTCIPYGSLL